MMPPTRAFTDSPSFLALSRRAVERRGSTLRITCTVGFDVFMKP